MLASNVPLTGALIFSLNRLLKRRIDIGVMEDFLPFAVFAEVDAGAADIDFDSFAADLHLPAFDAGGEGGVSEQAGPHPGCGNLPACDRPGYLFPRLSDCIPSKLAAADRMHDDAILVVGPNVFHRPDVARKDTVERGVKLI